MMKLSQKKTCDNCRALCTSQSSYSCTLGFEIDVSKRWHGVAIKFSPKEPCYKPLTNQNFVDALDITRGQKK